MFAQRLKDLRKAHPELTQAKLAEILDVSQQAVGLLERGKNMPSHELVFKIASFFNVTTDYLLGKSDQPQGTDFQKELLGDINSESPLAQKAREAKPNLDSKDLLAQLHQEGIMLDGRPLTAADAERLRDTIAFAIDQAKKTQGQQ